VSTGGRDRRLTRAFFALLAVVYLGVYPYLYLVNNPNENTRTYLVLALVDHHTFRLDEVVQRYGWTNDMARVPEPGGGHHLAAVKGPGMAYLGLPIYAAERLVLAAAGQRPPGPKASREEATSWLRRTTISLQLFAVHLPCYLFLVWFERRLRRWSPDVILRLATVAAVGLGTNYLGYSFVFVSHAIAAVVAFLGLDLLTGERLRSRDDPARSRPSVAFLAGLVAGASTLLEYQGAALSLVLAVYALFALRRVRLLAAFAAGALVDAGLLALFQWRSFGHPLTPGHRMMETEAYAGLVNQGFLGFSRPDPQALRALLFDQGFGLFGTSPFLWLGLAGLVAAALGWGLSGYRRIQRAEAIVAGGMVLVLALLIASSVIWRGGWTLGPRYLGAASSLLALPALGALELAARRWRREPVRALALGLALASFVQAGFVGLVVSTLPESIVRPFVQVGWPLARLGFVPHHAFELLGITSRHLFWLAPAAALGALVLAAVWASSRLVAARRLVGMALVALVASWPAWHLPAGVVDEGPAVRGFFARVWEPAGRDRLTAALERAKADPCAFREVAAMARTLGDEASAARAREGMAACTRP
jgi:hypothetical protein